MGENTKDAKIRAKLAAATPANLLLTYEHAARAFEASPQGPDADAYIILLSHLDIELLNREIPCCAECSVPDVLNFHIEALHNPAVAAAADVITDAAVAAVAAITTDDEDDDDDEDQGRGQPDGLLGPTQAELTHADELAKVRALATDPGILAMAGAWKESQ